MGLSLLPTPLPLSSPTVSSNRAASVAPAVLRISSAASRSLCSSSAPPASWHRRHPHPARDSHRPYLPVGWIHHSLPFRLDLHQSKPSLPLLWQQCRPEHPSARLPVRPCHG